MLTIFGSKAELGPVGRIRAEKTVAALERSERLLSRFAKAWRLLMRGHLLEAGGEREVARSRYQAVRSLESPRYNGTASRVPEQPLEGDALGLAPAGASR